MVDAADLSRRKEKSLAGRTSQPDLAISHRHLRQTFAKSYGMTPASIIVFPEVATLQTRMCHRFDVEQRPGLKHHFETKTSYWVRTPLSHSHPAGQQKNGAEDSSLHRSRRTINTAEHRNTICGNIKPTLASKNGRWKTNVNHVSWFRDVETCLDGACKKNGTVQQFEDHVMSQCAFAVFLVSGSPLALTFSITMCLGCSVLSPLALAFTITVCLGCSVLSFSNLCNMAADISGKSM